MHSLYSYNSFIYSFSWAFIYIVFPLPNQLIDETDETASSEDPGADSRGERQIKRAKWMRAETGGNSPWEDTFNGLVQEPICVLASD